MKWIIGLVVVAVLGWFGYQSVSKNAAIDAQNVAAEAAATAKASATEAVSKVQDSMPEGVDLSAITDNLDGVFSSTGEAFSGITDVDSATAALPSLEDASSKLSGLSDTIARLPDVARGPIAGIVEGGLATLQPLIEKVTAIPGVGPVIEPVVLPMLAKLQELAG